MHTAVQISRVLAMYACLPVRVCMCAVFIALAQRDAGIPSGALMSTCQLCTGAIIMIASVHVECAAHRMTVYQSAPSNSCAISRYHRVTVVRSNFDEESFDFAFLMVVLDAAF